tara:strand:- start:1990 stop:2187 length:198 start_codon:yes stop_codon:yes gene_type:complete
MVEDYISGVTLVSDENGNMGRVASVVSDKETGEYLVSWLNYSGDLEMKPMSSFRIIKKFNGNNNN